MDVIYDSIFRLGSKGLSAQNRFKREHECLYVRLGFQVLSGAKVFFSFFFFQILNYLSLHCREQFQNLGFAL